MSAGLGAVDQVLLVPPRCLSDFGSTLDEVVALQGVQTIDWLLRCGACGEHQFGLLTVSTPFGDDGDPYDVGIRLRCVACGNDQLLFDCVDHGWDGELGNVDFLAGPRSVREFLDSNGDSTGIVRVRAGFTYNIALDELTRIWREEKVEVRDLFDWFTLEVSTAAQAWRCVWDCECA